MRRFIDPSTVSRNGSCGSDRFPRDHDAGGSYDPGREACNVFRAPAESRKSDFRVLDFKSGLGQIAAQILDAVHELRKLRQPAKSIDDAQASVCETMYECSAVAPHQHGAPARSKHTRGLEREDLQSLRALLIEELTTREFIDTRIFERQGQRVAANDGKTVGKCRSARIGVEIDAEYEARPVHQGSQHEARAATDVQHGGGIRVQQFVQYGLLAQEVRARTIPVGQGTALAEAPAYAGVQAVGPLVTSHAFHHRRCSEYQSRPYAATMISAAKLGLFIIYQPKDVFHANGDPRREFAAVLNKS